MLSRILTAILLVSILSVTPVLSLIRDHDNVKEIPGDPDTKICLGMETRNVDATMQVNASELIRELPPGMYGTNLQYTGHGDGIFDPVSNTFKPGIVPKTREAGVKTIRFPGGGLSDQYHWRNGVGPQTQRRTGINYFTKEVEPNDYGIDEHMRFCKAVGASATITADFGNGTPLEAANWVEYCNGQVPSNGTEGWTVDMYDGNESAPPGYFAWLRASFGHSEPYNITWWEVGNEIYNDWSYHCNATQYANSFKDFAQAMRVVDPNIKIAAVGYDRAEDGWNGDPVSWNRQVARIAGQYMDALNIHTYTPGWDGCSIGMFWNSAVGRDIFFPADGNYSIGVLAQGLNTIGPYPPSDGIYSNLQIGIDGVPRANISLDSISPEYYSATIRVSAGTHNLSIGFTNDLYDPVHGDGRDMIFYYKVDVMGPSGNFSVAYTSENGTYNGLMAGPVDIREQVEGIKSILAQESGRGDIELWVTEMNVLYGITGLRLDMSLEFRSAVAFSDIMIQHVQAGATIIQPWSLAANWVLGMLVDADTLAERPTYHAMKLITSGTRKTLVNSSITSPTFDLDEDFGFIDKMQNIPYLNGMATTNDSGMSVLMVNKEPDRPLNVSLDVKGMVLNGTARITTVSSAAPDTQDVNADDDIYTYGTGKVGQGIHLNRSLPLMHPSRNNIMANEGTVEFWVSLDQPGSDTLMHPVMSAGNKFLIGTSGTGYMVALLFNSNFSTMALASADIASWNAHEWHHVAVTWANNGNLSIFADGSLTSTVPIPFNYTYIDTMAGIVIGSSYLNRSQGLNGYLDDLRISSTLHSPSSISLAYATGAASTPLHVDSDTTVLFHFDGDIRDSQRDERTRITSRALQLNSTGGIIVLPPCSLTLVVFDRDMSYYRPDLIISSAGVRRQHLNLGENVSLWANVTNSGRWGYDDNILVRFTVGNKSFEATDPFAGSGLAIGEYRLFQLEAPLGNTWGNLSVDMELLTNGSLELNTSNNGYPSDWVNISYYLEPTPLMAPTMTAATQLDNTTISVNWSKSEDGLLHLEALHGGNWTEVYNDPANMSTVHNGSTNITANTSGIYSFRGILTLPHRIPSAPGNVLGVNFTLPDTKLTPPVVQPLGIPVLDVNALDDDGEYWVLWTTVLNATGYMLEESSTAGAIILYNGSNTSFFVSTRPDGIYSYRIRAYNSTLTGNWSLEAPVNVTHPALEKMGPRITAHSFDPAEPTTSSTITFRITIEEHDAIVSGVSLTVCQGTMCSLPMTMTPLGNGSYSSLVGPYSAGEAEFTVTVHHNMGDPVTAVYHLNVTNTQPHIAPPIPTDGGNGGGTPYTAIVIVIVAVLVLLLIAGGILFVIVRSRGQRGSTPQPDRDIPEDQEEEEEDEKKLTVKMARNERIDTKMEHSDGDLDVIPGVKKREMPTGIPVIKDAYAETDEPGMMPPETTEPETTEPETTEPETEGPGMEGPETEGPETEGPETEGPGTEGPGTEGPGTEGPGTEGPGTEGPGTEGPETEGPGTEGPETEGPEELLEIDELDMD